MHVSLISHYPVGTLGGISDASRAEQIHPGLVLPEWKCTASSYMFPSHHLPARTICISSIFWGILRAFNSSPHTQPVLSFSHFVHSRFPMSIFWNCPTINPMHFPISKPRWTWNQVQGNTAPLSISVDCDFVGSGFVLLEQVLSKSHLFFNKCFQGYG